jgi:putative endonuclease
MAGNAAVGRRGESIAARYLERLGYAIRERNFRCPHGEIDLVASKDQYLVFVEVKTRSEETPFPPTLAITPAKRTQVRKLGNYYCVGHPEIALQPRFDVITVVLRPRRGGEAEEQVEHYLNAF